MNAKVKGFLITAAIFYAGILVYDAGKLPGTKAAKAGA